LEESVKQPNKVYHVFSNSIIEAHILKCFFYSFETIISIMLKYQLSVLYYILIIWAHLNGHTLMGTP